MLQQCPLTQDAYINPIRSKCMSVCSHNAVGEVFETQKNKMRMSRWEERKRSGGGGGGGSVVLSGR